MFFSQSFGLTGLKWAGGTRIFWSSHVTHALLRGKLCRCPPKAGADHCAFHMRSSNHFSCQDFGDIRCALDRIDLDVIPHQHFLGGAFHFLIIVSHFVMDDPDAMGMV